MDQVRLPTLFRDSPFPQNGLIEPLITYRPSTTLYEAGSKIVFNSSTDVLAAGFLMKWVIKPILILFTPIVLLAITIHFFAKKLFYNIDFKTYFAIYFVLGAGSIDRRSAEKNRSQLEGLTMTNHDSLKNLHTVAKSMLTEAKQDAEKISTAFNAIKHIENSHTFSFEEIGIPGSCAMLDGFAVCNYKMSSVPYNEQKWIIYYPGRSTCWENSYSTIYQLSKLTGANVLAFNYRGVMRSGRKRLDNPESPQEVSNSAEKLAEDAEAAVAHLLKMRVSKDRILNYGYSLGGGVASTQTDMAICSDRSFRSLDKVIQSFTWIPGVAFLASWIAQYCFGKINSYENVKKIQENGHDAYICTSPQDLIISSSHASLHSAFQENSPENTPPTLVIEHDDSKGSLFEKLKKRYIAHVADTPDTLFFLIKPWLERVDA